MRRTGIKFVLALIGLHESTRFVNETRDKLSIHLNDTRCPDKSGEIVVPIDIFADLFPVVPNDENQFGEVRDFNERFEKIVEDRTPGDNI